MGQQSSHHRVTPLSVPRAAERNPRRTVEIADAAGVCQVFARDSGSGTGRQVTDLAGGVDLCEIEPDGAHLWWFDAGPDGVGRWIREPFDGGARSDVLTATPAGRMYGAATRPAAAAISVGVEGGSLCYVGSPGGTGQLVDTTPAYQALVDLAPGADVIALAGSPDGADAVRILNAGTGRTMTRLAGGSGRRIWPMEFLTDTGPEPELLLVLADGGRFTLATWRPTGGLRAHDWLSFQAEISARWCGPGRTVLVQHDQAGRSRLLTVGLDRGMVTTLTTPRGTILDAHLTPDGPLRCVWTRVGTPPRLLTLPLPSPSAEPVATGLGGNASRADVGDAPGRYRELSTTTPYGQIHSFLATPPGPAPWPTIFLVHGGPATHDRDGYDPQVEFFTEAGFAVVRTNYRGSTGYGPHWRRIDPDRVGLAQVEDLAAVRDQLIRTGVATPRRIGLLGHSWGGYLVLLALGVAPERWDLGLAVAPVADYPAAFAATTPAVREMDRELFGGSPEEVPDRYRTASPMTYVDTVRGPLFIAGSADDPKCPWTQIERYAAALHRRDVPSRLVPIGGGHSSRAAADHVALLTAMRDFAGAVLGAAIPSVSGAVGPRARRRAGGKTADAAVRRRATSPPPDPAHPAGSR